jgi:hypothetical protein
LGAFVERVVKNINFIGRRIVALGEVRHVAVRFEMHGGRKN